MAGDSDSGPMDADMRLSGSRRLTGPNLLLDRPGAAIEIKRQRQHSDDAIAAWQHHARALLDGVGWERHETAWRAYPGGLSLAISAPIDALYAACEVNEAAWAAAEADLGGRPTPANDDALELLRGLIEREENPALVALAAAARQRRVSLLNDDEQVSVGLGAGCRVWPIDRPPHPDQVPWGEIHDVPVALVTGTNGKTTTVRMLGAIARAGGLVVGNTSTDGVQIDGELLLRGDYTGGEGARTLLRDRRVEIALLETARGGMLRRGLPVARADAAYVTNVGTDHLGEYGILDLESLAQVKLIVERAVHQGGTLIANADDPVLAPRVATLGQPVTWITLDPDGDRTGPPGDRRYGCRGGAIGSWVGDTWEAWVPLQEVPSTLGGAAQHNVYNALGAMALAVALGMPKEAICSGLASFQSSSQDNPGRGNLFDLGGARAYADFAHNPEGLEAVLAMAGRIDAPRTLLLLGQAGDRDDASIRRLAKITWNAQPDRIVLKEMQQVLRGRPAGEVVGLLRNALLGAGCPEDRIEVAESESEAVRRALAWTRSGDLLLLLLHAERQRMLEYLEALVEQGWSPGDPAPRAGDG